MALRQNTTFLIIDLHIRQLLSFSKPVCKKIIKSFIKKYPDFSLSMGIAETGKESYIDDASLIKDADEKMYLAKKESGTKICF